MIDGTQLILVMSTFPAHDCDLTLAVMRDRHAARIRQAMRLCSDSNTTVTLKAPSLLWVSETHDRGRRPCSRASEAWLH